MASPKTNKDWFDIALVILRGNYPRYSINTAEGIIDLHLTPEEVFEKELFVDECLSKLFNISENLTLIETTREIIKSLRAGKVLKEFSFIESIEDRIKYAKFIYKGALKPFGDHGIDSYMDARNDCLQKFLNTIIKR